MTLFENLPQPERRARTRELAADILRQAAKLDAAARHAWDVEQVEYLVSDETIHALRLLAYDNDVLYPRYAGPVSEHERLTDTFASFSAVSMAAEVANGTLMGVRLRGAFDIPDGELRLTVKASS